MSTREASDKGAFRDRHANRGILFALVPVADESFGNIAPWANRHPSRGELDALASARQIIRPRAIHLHRGIGRRYLINLAEELSFQNRFERPEPWLMVGRRDNGAFEVQRIGFPVRTGP